MDSLILLLQSILTSQAVLEFRPAYKEALAVSSYAGMFTGAIIWGLSADLIGRKLAFNVSLFICSFFCMISGAAPSWPALSLFQALTGFGGGGNLILDTTLFLEYLPSKKQWALTLLAGSWGIGQTVAALIAWGFMCR